MSKQILSAILATLAVSLSTLGAAQQAVPLKSEGAVVATLMQNANPLKPYIAQLFTPAAKPMALLQDSPNDHVHHHGLMFALAANGTVFWEEKGKGFFGKEEAVKTSINQAANEVTQQIDWLAKGDAKILCETRRIQVRRTQYQGDQVNWLNWQSVLTPAAGVKSVSLSGHHYYGLGMRFEPAWKGVNSFMWQDSSVQVTVRNEEKLTDGKWIAVSHKLPQGEATIIMFARPENTLPVKWFSMYNNFCYMSAAYNLHRKRYLLAADKKFVSATGIAVLNKIATKQEINELYDVWLKSSAAFFSAN